MPNMPHSIRTLLRTGEFQPFRRNESAGEPKMRLSISIFGICHRFLRVPCHTILKDQLSSRFIAGVASSLASSLDTGLCFQKVCAEIPFPAEANREKTATCRSSIGQTTNQRLGCSCPTLCPSISPTGGWEVHSDTVSREATWSGR